MNKVFTVILLKQSALDNPIQININSSALQTTVNVTGRAGVNNLKKQFPLPGWQVAEGAADYQLKLQLPYDDKSPELAGAVKVGGCRIGFAGRISQDERAATTFIPDVWFSG